MTDHELRNWALQRYGSEDLARKLAIVRQLQRDEHPVVVSVVMRELGKSDDELIRLKRSTV